MSIVRRQAQFPTLLDGEADPVGHRHRLVRHRILVKRKGAVGQADKKTALCEIVLESGHHIPRNLACGRVVFAARLHNQWEIAGIEDRRIGHVRPRQFLDMQTASLNQNAASPMSGSTPTVYPEN